MLLDEIDYILRRACTAMLCTCPQNHMAHHRVACDDCGYLLPRSHLGCQRVVVTFVLPARKPSLGACIAYVHLIISNASPGGWVLIRDKRVTAGWNSKQTKISAAEVCCEG